MKNIITLMLVVITLSSKAQFSLQPQLGLDNSKTTISSNTFSSFAPHGMQFAPRLVFVLATL